MDQSTTIDNVGKILIDNDVPLKKRFRALFTLKNLGGIDSIDWIAKTFSDPSALLKHECAYCLGQMQNKAAIPVLCDVLENKTEDPMVRHEAGEALGAIGSTEVLELLTAYTKDPVVEVAETCQLAVERIKWLNSEAATSETLSSNPFASVDPAPPCPETDIPALGQLLLNEEEPLFKRYRAMFSLRNINSKESTLELAKGLQCKSALFRHEIAYVLGQMQNEAAVTALKNNLVLHDESPMVRHECAEALGSIATDECTQVLSEFKNDPERVVKESCDVALDMCEYENSEEFQYADGLVNGVKSG